MDQNQKNLYLIPSSLGVDNIHEYVNQAVKNALVSVQVLIVENAKPARAFIKSLELEKHISEFAIEELEKNDNWLELDKIFTTSHTIGFMSDAGLPCIADPGNIIVNLARKKGYIVSPLVGPSSIMLALMASGFNGQQFTFHGYLAYDSASLTKQLQKMEQISLNDDYTQIFIETPYRNDKLFKTLMEKLNPNIRLCIAINLLQNDFIIETKIISEWRKSTFEIGKRPTIFLIGR
jgi:16S rRNA (cytidine1402-2'-O)-methyltransferase